MGVPPAHARLCGVPIMSWGVILPVALWRLISARPYRASCERWPAGRRDLSAIGRDGYRSLVRRAGLWRSAPGRVWPPAARPGSSRLVPAPRGPAAGRGSGPAAASSLPARCLNARLFKLQGSVCVAGDGGEISGECSRAAAALRGSCRSERRCLWRSVRPPLSDQVPRHHLTPCTVHSAHRPTQCTVHTD